MTYELAEKAKILAIYAKFSRIIIDCNRPLDHPDLIRNKIEDNVYLKMNNEENLDIEHRVKTYYEPYFKTLKVLLNSVKPKYILRIHSYNTFDIEGDKQFRDYEIGILYMNKGKLVEAVKILIF